MLQAAQTAWDFFLIHAAADKSHARALYSALGSKHRTFLDEASIPHGSIWPKEIEAAMQSAVIFVVLISQKLRDGFYALDEIATAIFLTRNDSGRRAIVPIYIDGSRDNFSDAPYGLRLIQGIDFSKHSNWTEIANELFSKLKSLGTSAEKGPILESVSRSHALHRFPRGPILEIDYVKGSVVKEYAKAIRGNEQLQVIADAIAFRREADPKVQRLPVIDETKLLPTSVPPIDFWHVAFNQARKNGPRMLAALLLVVSNDLFSEPGRTERDEMLEQLARLPPY